MDQGSRAPSHNPSPGLTVSGLRDGLVLGWPFLLSSGTTGLAMGVACRGAGIDANLALVFSAAVYSGSAQAAVLGVAASGAPLLALLLAVVAVNARYLAMGAQLAALFPDVPRRRMLPLLPMLVDGAFLLTAAEARRGRRDLGLLLGASLPMFAGWVVGTAVGHATALTLGGPLAVAAAFLPLGFVACLLPAQWSGRPSLVGWGVGAVVAAALLGQVEDHWTMLAAGLAGTGASLLAEGTRDGR